MSIDVEDEDEENRDWWTKYFASLEAAGQVTIIILLSRGTITSSNHWYNLPINLCRSMTPDAFNRAKKTGQDNRLRPKPSLHSTEGSTSTFTTTTWDMLAITTWW